MGLWSCRDLLQVVRTPTPQQPPLKSLATRAHLLHFFPGHCIPKLSSTSLLQFPHEATCVKASSSTSFLPESPGAQHFVNGMTFSSNLKYYPHTCHGSDILRQQQWAGQSLLSWRLCQVKGSYGDMGGSVTGCAHGERSSLDLAGGGDVQTKKTTTCRKKETPCWALRLERCQTGEQGAESMFGPNSLLQSQEQDGL